MMATMTLRVDDELKERLEDAAATMGVSVSELVRRQLEVLLGETEHRGLTGAERGEGMTPVSLRSVDRKILSMLHDIMDKIGDDEVEDGYHKVQAKVLRYGYVGEYAEEFADIDPELSRQDCEFVWDLLDLFRVLGANIRRLSPEDRAALGDGVVRDLTFSGLDANNTRELSLLVYARHLIEQGKWEELAHHFGDAADRGNSHTQMLPEYQRMLAVYTPIFKSKIRLSVGGLNFTLDELRSIANASRARGY